MILYIIATYPTWLFTKYLNWMILYTQLYTQVIHTDYTHNYTHRLYTQLYTQTTNNQASNVHTCQDPKITIKLVITLPFNLDHTRNISGLRFFLF